MSDFLIPFASFVLGLLLHSTSNRRICREDPVIFVLILAMVALAFILGFVAPKGH